MKKILGLAGIAATGTLTPVTTVEVGTRASGQVAELFVDINDQVTKRRLLARIGHDDFATHGGGGAGFLRCDRDLLRLLSRPAGRRARSDRGVALRVSEVGCPKTGSAAVRRSRSRDSGVTRPAAEPAPADIHMQRENAAM